MKNFNSNTYNDTRVHLTVSGFECYPSEITKILNLTPSKTWQAQELVDERTIHRHKQNGWRISSSLPTDRCLVDHIENLMLTIAAHKENFKNLPNTCHIQLQCWIDIYESVPEISFNVSIIQLLSELKAEIDVDLYCLMDNED